jgi:P27 family predicted phage terminase small subunit
MAIAGKKRTPAAIRKLEGNRAKTPIPAEPIGQKGAPVAYHDLDGPALYEWQRVVPALESMGLLDKVIDRAALVIYCDLWGELVKVNREIKKIPYLSDSQSGASVVNPLYTLKLKLTDQVRKYLNEFGMTPTARTRLSVGKEQAEKDALQDLLSHGKRQN